MIHIGIDPGKTGCIAVIDYGDAKTLHVTIHQIKKISSSKLVDEHELNEFFKKIAGLRYKKHHIVLEDVHSVFGSSASAMFNFGDVCGLIRGMIIAHDLSFTKVQPKVWQKEMFQGIPEIRKPGKNGRPGPIDTKPMSIAAAKRLFPNVSLKTNDRKGAIDQNGISDALLMAEYSRRKFS